MKRLVAATALVALLGCSSGASGGGGSAAPATTRSPASAPRTPGSPSAPGAPAAPPATRPSAPVAHPFLTQGDSGDAVRIFQDLLCEARRRDGLAPIGIDAAFGPKTATAVRELQTARGLPATGSVDEKTWDGVLSATAASPLGAIDPAAAATTGDVYQRSSASTTDVEIHALPGALLYESQMSIDADGAGTAWQQDPYGQPQTSLQDANGHSLDPTKTPYFVLPGGFTAKHAGVKLGDIAAVIHAGKVVYAIYGDVGPTGKIGEGSIRLAELLGIPASPTSGGVSSGVFYIVFPGSGTGRPLSNAEIDQRGAARLAQSGGKP